jgi:murein DD-endopeptidase MepM/ murein hydrolase activator NlpD
MGKLHEPVKNFKPQGFPEGDVTQFFGENKALYSKAVCFNRDCLQGHNGWDIVRAWGTPIMAVEGGIVVNVKNDAGGFGKHVTILSDGSEWTYGHLSEINVWLGQRVEAGQVIGKMGNTGFVVSSPTPFWKHNPYAGTHLHLGRRIVNHARGAYVTYQSGNTAYIENYNNGFFGAVTFKASDFAPAVSVTPVQPTQPSVEMTIQSLENHATKAAEEGRKTQAAIYRAVASMVRAFAK